MDSKLTTPSKCLFLLFYSCVLNIQLIPETAIGNIPKSNGYKIESERETTKKKNIFKI